MDRDFHALLKFIFDGPKIHAWSVYVLPRGLGMSMSMSMSMS